MEYIAPPIVTEPDDLSAEAFAYLEDAIPGWLPAEGNLETWLIEALAQLAGELADVASAVPTAIFRYFGESILNLPPHPAAAATAQTTWTVAGTAGYTIPQGTLIAIPASGSDLAPFETSQDTIIAAPATSAQIVCVAAEAGTDANGLTGTPELVDALDFVSAISLDAPTGGGSDEESDEDYLNRLRELLTLLAPRPILPGDFAVMAKTVAGVYRATAIDLHQAGTPESPATGPSTPIPPASADGVARCVTVAVVAEDGNPVAPAVKQSVANLLDAAREVNFLVYVIDPQYTTIAVDFTVKLFAQYDPTDAIARTVQAVTDYLSPAGFGVPPFGDQAAWINDNKVRYLEIAQVVNGVEGVNYIVSLTVNGGTADIALTGTAPLPRPGAITGHAA
jgi:hypothetical protein